MKDVIIVGGGISGLAVAARLVAAGVTETLVLESEGYAGGRCRTIEREGFLVEAGNNGFLDNKPATLAFISDMGLSDIVVRSNDNSRKRFVFSGRRLHQLPEDPAGFMKSELVSWPGKIRMGMEYFVPPRREMGEESLADFARRRLGPEALAKLLDPMASGIYAGNPEEMSLQACFPKVDLLEKRYGGLLRGMAGMQKEAAKAGKRGPDGAGPGGVLHSFVLGVTQLIDAVVARIGADKVLRDAPVTKVEVIPGGYRVVSAAGVFEGRAVILASPSFVTGSLLSSIDGPLSDEVGRIPYNKVAVVGLGYRREDLTCDVDAFGYLIPSGEGRRILGTLYDSSIFPHRAPEGHVLLRSIIGGARRPDLVDLSPDTLVELNRDELRDILGIKAAPVMTEVVHWHRAIPQYRVGHLERLERIECRRRAIPGLFLTGNSYRGVSINDCMADAEQLAPAVAAFLS